MKEVSTRVHLHLVQLTYEPEVDHGTYSFPCYHLRVPARCVDGLYLAEGGANHGANQESWLLLLMQSPCLLPICLDVEIPRRSHFLVHREIQ